MSTMNLIGKTVLITGASSGIGQGTAITLSQLGARLIISGRDTARLNDTLEQLAGEGHLAICADLSTAEELDQLVAQCPKLHGIVHSAGQQGVSPVHLFHDEFADAVFNTNTIAPIKLTKRLLMGGKIERGGSIVFLTSIAAHTGTRGVALYSASKAALLGYTRAAAIELAPKRIRVNCVAPGLVVTPLIEEHDNIANKGWLEEQATRYPLGLGKVDDVANACAFLLSDLSRYMTGTSLVMDGGCTWV
jgi:NAD(P)-dependent dehydrogenase (short-subunit alcohol dehydrogenase family)